MHFSWDKQTLQQSGTLVVQKNYQPSSCSWISVSARSLPGKGNTATAHDCLVASEQSLDFVYSNYGDKPMFYLPKQICRIETPRSWKHLSLAPPRPRQHAHPQMWLSHCEPLNQLLLFISLMLLHLIRRWLLRGPDRSNLINVFIETSFRATAFPKWVPFGTMGQVLLPNQSIYKHKSQRALRSVDSLNCTKRQTCLNIGGKKIAAAGFLHFKYLIIHFWVWKFWVLPNSIANASHAPAAIAARACHNQILKPSGLTGLSRDPSRWGISNSPQVFLVLPSFSRQPLRQPQSLKMLWIENPIILHLTRVPFKPSEPECRS